MKHWIMRAKYLDTATGEIMYSPDTRSFPKAQGQAQARRGDWEFVEEIEAEGRADGTGGVKGPIPKNAVKSADVQRKPAKSAVSTKE